MLRCETNYCAEQQFVPSSVQQRQSLRRDEMTKYKNMLTAEEHHQIMLKARRMQSQTIINGLGIGFSWTAAKLGNLLGLRTTSHEVSDFTSHQMRDIGMKRSWSDMVDARRANINGDLALSAQ